MLETGNIIKLYYWHYKMCKFTVYKVMNEFNVYDSYEIVMDVHILTLINYLNIVKRKKEKSILMSLFDSLIDIEKFFLHSIHENCFTPV